MINDYKNLMTFSVAQHKKENSMSFIILVYVNLNTKFF